jgi:putative membrane protein
MLALFAESTWDWSHFGMAMLAAAAFGVLGIVMLVAGFKIFESMTPKVDLEAELAKGNMAVGIVVAAMIIAMALILKMAIGS